VYWTKNPNSTGARTIGSLKRLKRREMAEIEVKSRANSSRIFLKAGSTKRTLLSPLP
jgi:hypothetical protein